MALPLLVTHNAAQLIQRGDPSPAADNALDRQVVALDGVEQVPGPIGNLSDGSRREQVGHKKQAFLGQIDDQHAIHMHGLNRVDNNHPIFIHEKLAFIPDRLNDRNSRATLEAVRDLGVQGPKGVLKEGDVQRAGHHNRIGRHIGPQPTRVLAMKMRIHDKPDRLGRKSLA